MLQPSQSDSRRLPQGWMCPRPNPQATLFTVATDEALARLCVQRGEVRRWRDLGWISFDVDAMDRLDQPEEWEIAFVRNVARSGLSIKQIEELLADLPRPLRYDPENTVYHFAHGWVAPRSEDPFDVVDREVEGWIEAMAQEGRVDRLKAIAEATDEALGPDAECG